MPKATEAPTTPTATTLPPVIDLGRRIASLQREYDRQNQSALDARGNSRSESDAKSAQTILQAQIEALRALVATVPARSMADAAVQIAEAFMLAEDLESNEVAVARVYSHASALTKLLLSVLPVVAAAAGLDAGEMGWEAELGYLRECRFAGLEGVV